MIFFDIARYVCVPITASTRPLSRGDDSISIGALAAVREIIDQRQQSTSPIENLNPREVSTVSMSVTLSL
jgi:hypothetical protein